MRNPLMLLLSTVGIAVAALGMAPLLSAGEGDTKAVETIALNDVERAGGNDAESGGEGVDAGVENDTGTESGDSRNPGVMEQLSNRQPDDLEEVGDRPTSETDEQCVIRPGERLRFPAREDSDDCTVGVSMEFAAEDPRED